MGGPLADPSAPGARRLRGRGARATRAVRVVPRPASLAGHEGGLPGSQRRHRDHGDAAGEPCRLPSQRPPCRGSRRRGRVLRRTNDAACRSGHPRPAYRCRAAADSRLRPSTVAAMAWSGQAIPAVREGRLRDDVTRITQTAGRRAGGADITCPGAVAPPAAQLAHRSGTCRTRTTLRPADPRQARMVSAAVQPGTTASVGRHEDRPHLSVQPDHPRRRPGPGTGPRPDAAVLRPSHPGARTVRRPAARCRRHPLGNSLPTAANGSMAPIAPDVSCALRTIRALRDEEFDVIHLHEPLAPGPTTTALFLAAAPMVGTFHAAGGSLAYDVMNRGVRWLNRRLDRSFAVSDDAAAMAPHPWAAEYEILFNGVEVQRSRQVAAMADRGTDRLLHRAPRAPQGPQRAARRHVAPAGPTYGSGWPATARRPRPCGPGVAGDARISWLGRISDEERTATDPGR